MVPRLWKLCASCSVTERTVDRNSVSILGCCSLQVHNWTVYFIWL